MKIAQQANFINIEVSDPSPRSGPAKSQEKLAFNGKASEIDRGHGFGKKFIVKWSADGQTMTINSIVHLMVPAPYHINVQKQLIVYVTEIWKLSNDGKSIAIQANARSNMFDKGRSWTTIFDKATWYSKYFL
jgi:hypothetical protein